MNNTLAAEFDRERQRMTALRDTGLFDDAHRRRFGLLADLPAALAAPDQLALVFQPRVDLRSGDCVGAEALLRWRHPVLGDILPGEFIPVVEQTPLARDLTEWVLRTAVAQAASWRDAGLDLAVSVNVSPINLEENDFASRISALVAQSELPPEAIELELSEGALLRLGHGAAEQMAALAVAGFRLAIDDFGACHGSLPPLATIPARAIKFDPSFTRCLGHGTRNEALVGATVQLFHALGYWVVAEGVESEQVYETLLDLGCDEVQGFLVGRPLPAAAFANLVARNNGVWRLAAAAVA